MLECEFHGVTGCNDCHPATPLPGVRVSDRAARVEANYRTWTDLERTIAKDLKYADAEVAELLDRTPHGVHLFRLRTGIIAKSQERNLDYGHARVMARWTPNELTYLKENATAPMDDLVRMLGRSAAAIRHRLERGL